MIKKIVVRDFQSLKRKVIRLSPTVTTIVGDNDEGKTALIRAILVLSLNSHRSPNIFIREGSKGFDIALYVDQHKIGRKKGKSGNIYTLDGKKYKFDSTRIRVPEKIAAILNIGRENFQLQQDQHYWFSETPGQVSKRINEIVNLSKIDSSLKAINTEVHLAESRLKLLEQELEDARKRARTFKRIPKLALAVRSLERMRGRAERASSVASELRSTLQQWRDTLNRQKRLSIAYRAIKRVVKIGNLAERRAAKLKELQELLSDWKEARQEVKMRVPNLKRLERLRKVGDEQSERHGELVWGVKDWRKAKKEVKELNGELEQIERQIRKLEKETKICPTCGQRLPKGKKHKHD